ncbi:hypothetical protein BIW11_02574 [Tropilaelaps mercedesae]|uniref:Uncharacterized protein n=1 Tax=Tropilaelaps mercedesae TaxID=418985 RepID=A0A1V9Y0S7_9ACAR|nr:hypothetical protein BIW11_02574 [Tropilaelaps mercedesae]
MEDAILAWVTPVSACRCFGAALKRSMVHMGVVLHFPLSVGLGVLSEPTAKKPVFPVQAVSFVPATATFTSQENPSCHASDHGCQD